jgi:hypothetical protein
MFTNREMIYFFGVSQRVRVTRPLSTIAEVEPVLLDSRDHRLLRVVERRVQILLRVLEHGAP